MDIDQETTYPVMCIVLNFTKDGKSVFHFSNLSFIFNAKGNSFITKTSHFWSLSNIGMKTWKDIIKQRKPGQIPMHEKAKWYEAVEEICLYGSVQNIRSFVRWFGIITDRRTSEEEGNDFQNPGGVSTGRKHNGDFYFNLLIA